jgi:hypothetical protein
MFRTAAEAMTFFSAGEWVFTRTVNYRLGGGVGTVAGVATWKAWGQAVPPGAVTSVDRAPLPEREQLLLYDEVRPKQRPAAAPAQGWCQHRLLPSIPLDSP